MKKTLLLSVVIMCMGFVKGVKAQPKIMDFVKVYFMQAPDVSVSSGVNAVCLTNSVFDTLAKYIDRAKYTVDIAQYEYQTYSGDPIYVAINAAYARGVKVRYIQDGSQAATNSGVKLLTTAIPIATSPTGGVYNIMHNKFVIIDEFSPDTTKAILWTGSPDWDNAMNTCDYNNVIIFQSKVLARAYTHEFDIMWGDTTHGAATNTSLSAFGPKKAPSGTNLFNIGGAKVELYFSPSDGVNNEIVSTIATATTDIYCGMFTFTETTDASDIDARKTAGAYTAVILDNYSSGTYAPYTTTFPAALGKNFTGFVSSSCLYHNKYLIVNPSAPCDDPKVLTGSHNWTATANSTNDENTVIVHDPTIANLYMQAFYGDFKTISGTALVAPKNPCPVTTGINSIPSAVSEMKVYPNPFKGNVTISYDLAAEANVDMCIYNMIGQKVSTIISNEKLESGQHVFQFTGAAPGVYFLQVKEGGNTYVKKLIQTE